MFCKNCGKENNDNDKFCSNCGQDLTNNSPSGSKNEAPKKGGCGKGCGIGCLVVFILFVLLSLIGSSDNTPYEQDISTQQSNAKFHCQEAVKSKLKNPADAEFPDITEHSFENLGEMVYTVKSYVDATNSFGATVRTNYSCKVKLIDEDNAEVQGVYLLSN